MKGKRVWVGLLVGMLAYSSVGVAFAQGTQPPARIDRRLAVVEGEVSAIDGQTLTVETLHRGTLAVQTDENTRFRARDDADFSLADIEVGDTIAARGHFTGSDTLQARLVLLVPDEVADHARGKVVAVDGDTIRIEDKDGNSIDVITTADTRFRVKGKPDASIDDVKVGMLLGAAGAFDAGGALVAQHVIAAEARGPRGGPIEGGVVAAVDGNQFVIDYPDGSSLTVVADAATLVIKRGDAGDGAAHGSLSDVVEGSRIIALGIPSGDKSSLTARVILLGGGQAQDDIGLPGL